MLPNTSTGYVVWSCCFITFCSVVLMVLSWTAASYDEPQPDCLCRCECPR